MHDPTSQGLPGPLPERSSGQNVSHPKAGVIIDALAWTAGLMGGFLSLFASSGKPKYKSGNQLTSDARAQQNPRDPGIDAKRQAMSGICRLTLGRTKRQVFSALGPPPAASLAQTQLSQAAASFWDANIWYYPLNPARQTAVAILFSRDRAAKLEYIGGLFE